jgi:hypothetical protein
MEGENKTKQKHTAIVLFLFLLLFELMDNI